MTLALQLMWGSLYLTLSCVIHVVILAALVAVIEKMQQGHKPHVTLRRTVLLLMVSLVFILFSHTIQVWIWALTLVHNDQILEWNTSVYFSLVTYTSVGYGDVVLGPNFRVYGAFAAVTGLLSFGLSTAYLVALMNRLILNRHR